MPETHELSTKSHEFARDVSQGLIVVFARVQRVEVRVDAEYHCLAVGDRLLGDS